MQCHAFTLCTAPFGPRGDSTNPLRIPLRKCHVFTWFLRRLGLSASLSKAVCWMGRKSWHPHTVGQNQSLQVSKSTSDLQTPCFWVPPCLLVGSKLLKLCSLKRWVSLETGRIPSCFPLFPGVLAKMSSLMVYQPWKTESTNHPVTGPSAEPALQLQGICFGKTSHALNFYTKIIKKSNHYNHYITQDENVTFPIPLHLWQPDNGTLEGITKHGKIAPAATHAGWAWLGFFSKQTPSKRLSKYLRWGKQMPR